MSETIFGKTPPPPPANVDPIEPNPVDAPKATLRVKLDAHKKNPSCAACHRKIDPLGFAFEAGLQKLRPTVDEVPEIRVLIEQVQDSPQRLPIATHVPGP